MSDETAGGAPAPTIEQGGSTKGLREAAIAKRQGQPANDNAKPASQAPQFKSKDRPSPAADSIADNEARAAKKKLPTKERAERNEAPDDREVAAAIEGEGDGEASASETIKIGDHEIPIAILEQLPDEALRRIKRKMKVGGEELEVTLIDALDLAPKGRDYMNKTRKLSQARKELEGIALKMKSEPLAALKAMGLSEDEALDVISHQLVSAEEYRRMDPKLRAEKERVAELEAKAQRVEEYERAEEQRQLAAKTAKLKQQYLAALDPVLKTAGLAPSAYVLKRIGHHISEAMADGSIKGDPTAEDLAWAAGEVANERKTDLDAELPEDGDALIARIGVDKARLIARAYAKSISRQPVAKPGGPAPKPANTNGGQRAGETFSEWRARANAEGARRDRARGIR